MTHVMTAALLVFTLAGPASPTQPAPRQSVSQAAQAAQLVNLNTANTQQLETLPGIGAATAQRIIEYRERNGGFKRVEDLMNIRGIGERSFLRLKPLITVTPSRGASSGQ